TLRIWYDDTTLTGAFYRDYHPRRPGEPAGPDLFFRYDSLRGLVEVARGPENIDSSRRDNPRWARDHVLLARTMASARAGAGAAVEFAKLAEADPTNVDLVFDAGVSAESAGDSIAALAWYRRAAALPGADADVRANLERLSRRLATIAVTD